MNRRTNLTPFILVLLLTFSLSAQAEVISTQGARVMTLHTLLNGDTDRDRDGLLGPVRRVKTEMVKLANRGGKAVEGQRVVIESFAYDIKGVKIENAYYPVPGAALTGKEVYKYDDKGNIVEMTMVNADGSLMSKEVYSYEVDAFGNWTRMTTSVAVIEGGKINYEPTEVTYRTISYYLDEATLAKMTQPVATAPTSAKPEPPSGPAAVASNASLNPSQPDTRTAGRPTPALPTAGLPAKVNMISSEGAFGVTGSSPSNDTAIRVESEPPPPAAARQIPKPLLKPISGGVLNGKAMMLPKPVYPPAARTARASGLVSVEVVIDEKGKVIAAKAVDGHALLRGVSVAAAQGARFSPTLLSGQPVKVAGLINYTFALQ